MKKIDKLTPEQEAQLEEFRAEWEKIGLATGPADPEALRPAISALYESIGRKAPDFWRCESPLMAQVVINLLKAKRSKDEARAMQEKLNSMEGNLIENIRSEVDIKLNYVPTWLWGSLEAYWIAYYLFPHKYLRPMHTDEQMELLGHWETIARNGFWWYPWEKLCFVCDRPTEIHKDDDARLHNEEGPSVAFSDGWKLYHVHGVEVPADVIEDPDSITVERIGDERNVEVRRVMIDRYGQARYIQDSGAKLIHSDGYGDLYRKEVDDDEDIVMVKVVDPSSDRDYFVRVDPTCDCVPAALAFMESDEAWETWQKEKKYYLPALES